MRRPQYATRSLEKHNAWLVNSGCCISGQWKVVVSLLTYTQISKGFHCLPSKKTFLLYCVYLLKSTFDSSFYYHLWNVMMMISMCFVYCGWLYDFMLEKMDLPFQTRKCKNHLSNGGFHLTPPVLHDHACMHYLS